MVKSEEKTLKCSMSRPFNVTTGWGTPLPKGIKERLKIHAVVLPEECKGGKLFKKKDKYLKIEDKWGLWW